MKRIFALLAILSSFLTACQTIELPDEETSTKSKLHNVSVNVRATTSEPLQYPLSVYAFDASGVLRGQQTIANAQAKLALALPAGNYRIVALGGHESYGLAGGNATLQTSLVPPNSNVATRPLMRGEASLEVKGTKAQVSLTMHYVVASLGLSLSGIPESVTAVTARFDRQYNRFTLNGDYSEPMTSTISCQRVANGTWTMPLSYVYPAASSATVLSLALTDAEQTRNFSFTLSNALKAATPYRLSGSYTHANEINISGEILSAGWQATVSQEFTFGSGQPIPIQPNDEPGGGSTGGDNPGGGSGGQGGNGGTVTPPTITLTGLPAPGSVWQGKHIVGLLENVTETGADIVLISLQKWDGVPSAKNTSSPNFIPSIVSLYEEGDLKQWTIPTKEEARALAKAYHGEALQTLNATIRSLGGEEIYDVIETKYERYLCENGNYTYSFKEDTSISAAGATSYNYFLLLVKRVHVNRQ